MTIPHAERAIIDATKLRDYLLSPIHPIGRFKAAFFHSIGYTQDASHQLDADLRTQHLTQECRVGPSSQFGQKYEIIAPIRGPTDRMTLVVSVWIILHGEEVPRFVTAYPGAPE